MELTPRQVLRDKKRASAGPKGQILSALKDDLFQIDLNRINLSFFLLFEVHITLGFQSEVFAFIIYVNSDFFPVELMTQHFFFFLAEQKKNDVIIYMTNIFSLYFAMCLCSKRLRVSENFFMIGIDRTQRVVLGTNVIKVGIHSYANLFKERSNPCPRYPTQLINCYSPGFYPAFNAFPHKRVKYRF